MVNRSRLFRRSKQPCLFGLAAGQLAVGRTKSLSRAISHGSGSTGGALSQSFTHVPACLQQRGLTGITSGARSFIVHHHPQSRPTIDQCSKAHTLYPRHCRLPKCRSQKKQRFCRRPSCDASVGPFMDSLPLSQLSSNPTPENRLVLSLPSHPRPTS